MRRSVCRYQGCDAVPTVQLSLQLAVKPAESGGRGRYLEQTSRTLCETHAQTVYEAFRASLPSDARSRRTRIPEG